MLLAASLGFDPAWGQQAWPAKPIHFVVPYAAGGFADIRARMIGVELAKTLGQPVVIENKPGAGGVLGTDAVAKAAPDGYTIGMGNLAPLAVNASLMKKLPYNPQKDLSPIILVETSPLILTAGPGLQAKSVKELIAMAKAKPGQIAFASSGIGGAHHLSGEMLRQMVGIDITHIAYKGGAPAATDLLAGHVPMMFEMGYAALPSIKGGKIRALAVTSTKRMPLLPEVPTMVEAGVPSFESYNWQGVIAPAGTPREIIERLNREINAILAQPSARNLIASTGSEVGGGTPDAFGALIRSETEKWGKVVKQAGIQPE
ncbi:MAG: tripartite tricarboxylate transporter substrate binding protein [Proteobacteria bacterium]|nr:tripartite tricarboxylate transporter substrate binding protein [Pseudomonadota bacterium]